MSEFFGLFLAVLLAILIAPQIQKHADTAWAGVTRIRFVQKNGVFLSFYLVGAVLIWTLVMIILPQLFPP
jgi:spermidine/putrescine transport system permease protein